MFLLNTNSLFVACTPTQSQINRVIRKASFIAPFLNCLIFAKRFNISSISSIFSLCCSRNPHAIFRKITQVVVNSFNRMTIRFNAHVIKKITVIKPSFANSYSSAAIILICFARRRVASFFNAFPYLICGSSFATTSVTMCFSSHDKSITEPKFIVKGLA
jgi:hypothetical protein